MPKLFELYGYKVYIWSSESGEPIHVHIAKRKASASGVKLWLLSNGTFVMANKNDKRIPEHTLRAIIVKLNANAMVVRNFWLAYHGYEKYYA